MASEGKHPLCFLSVRGTAVLVSVQNPDKVAEASALEEVRMRKMERYGSHIPHMDSVSLAGCEKLRQRLYAENMITFLFFLFFCGKLFFDVESVSG